MVSALAYQKRYDLALRAVEDAAVFGNHTPEASIYSYIVFGCITNGFLDVAYSTCMEMYHRKVATNKITTMAIKAISQTNTSQAIQLFDAHRKVTKPDVQMYTVLFAGITRAKAFNCVDQLCEYMDKDSIRIDSTLGAVMIKAFCDGKRINLALDLFKKIHMQHIEPTPAMYTMLLSACVNSELYDQAEELYSKIQQDKLEDNERFFNTMIHMYCKSGRMNEAIKLFNSIDSQYVTSTTCNVLLAGYVRNGQKDEAVALFDRIVENSEHVSIESVNTMISMYCRSGEIVQAMNLFHGLKKMSLQANSTTYATLISNQTVEEAENLFREAKENNQASIGVTTAMIKVYCANEKVEKALTMFTAMKRGGVKLDEQMYNVMLSGCSNNGLYKLGEEIYLEMGAPGNAYITTTMLKMYAKSNQLDKASSLFESLKKQNNVTNAAITVLLAGYMQVGRSKEAAAICDSLSDVKLDTELVNTMIKVYGQAGELSKAKELFLKLEPDAITYSVLITACSPATDVAFVDELVSRMGSALLSSHVCNALITYYFEANTPDKAFDVYYKAYAMGTQFGLEVYYQLLSNHTSMRFNFDIESMILSGEHVSDLNPCILMLCYACRAEYDRALSVFDECKDKTINLWNSVLAVFAKAGRGEDAVRALQQMTESGIKPTQQSYIQVLSACSHAQLTMEAEKIFFALPEAFLHDDIIISTMIDVYARNNQLEKAEQLASKVKTSTHIAWITVLSGCKLFNDAERGARIMKHIKMLPAANILLANIYASMNKWDEHAQVRTFIDANKLEKVAGESYVKIGNKLHRFTVEDKKATQAARQKLAELKQEISKYGCVPDTSCVLKPLASFDEKVKHLWEHSERLALGTALVANESKILITKNLRVCMDCHEAIRLMSKVVQKEIVIVDNKRNHKFTDGQCDCKGNY